jgi:signal transduction histidine kinase
VLAMDIEQVRGLDDPELLARLVEISVTLNSTLEPERLLHFIIDTAADLLHCERASILLYNETRRDLSFLSASDDDPGHLGEIPVPLEGSIAGLIFSRNEAVISNDVANDPRHFGAVGAKTGFVVKSLLGVPMHLRGKTTGVLEALNKREGEFTQQDARLLDVIASQAAVAIHNAQLVQNLQRAHAELSRVDQIKTNFMHLASHELRTPLAIIMSYAEFLRQRVEGTVTKHATAVLEAALRQRAIIDSMQNMNLLKLGILDLSLRPHFLQTMIKEVCEELRPDLETEKLTLKLALPKEPIEVRADAERLKLVFRNVLSNAIRFTPSGGEITVSMQAGAGEAVVSIRDTGLGIPPGELENIFKDYYQVADHMTRRHGGLGLGLSIARGIIQLHGGRIWAESAGPNQGSTFTVVLPRRES